MGKKKKREKLKLVVAELIRRHEQTQSYSNKQIDQQKVLNKQKK